MAQEQQTAAARGGARPPQDRLDPETRARREAALRHVRKYGDPVLRTRARPVEVFDGALADEVRRMGG